MSGLIWIQSLWHSDGILDFFLKVDFEKSADDKKAWKISTKAFIISLSKFIPALSIYGTYSNPNLNSFFVSGDLLSQQLITSANSLDPDQDQQNVGPGLDPNLLPLNSAPEGIFEKVNFEDNKSTKYYPACKSKESTFSQQN